MRAKKNVRCRFKYDRNGIDFLIQTCRQSADLTIFTTIEQLAICNHMLGRILYFKNLFHVSWVFFGCILLLYKLYFLLTLYGTGSPLSPPFSTSPLWKWTGPLSAGSAARRPTHLFPSLQVLSSNTSLQIGTYSTDTLLSQLWVLTWLLFSVYEITK